MEGRKKKAVHERQATGTAAGAFSALADARNASGGILTSTLRSHYRPEHEYNNDDAPFIGRGLFRCRSPQNSPDRRLSVFTRNYAAGVS